MNIIINSSSMVPIYEQIVETIKREIASGELAADTVLPSVRTLSKELKISALTVKKAYDQLEEDGLVTTVHGKGTFVKGLNPGIIREEQLKELEEDMTKMLDKAKRYGISNEELEEIFHMLIED